MTEETSPASSDIDADALEASATASTNQEIPMTSAETQPSKLESPKAPEVPTEFTLNVKGEQIKIPLTDPRVNQWLQQGRDYAQRMNEFNLRQKDIETKLKWAQEVESVYKPVDEWAKQNPEQWNTFQNQWQNFRTQNTQTPMDPNNPLMRELAELKTQFQPVAKTVQDLMNEKANQARQAEDVKLRGDIESVRKMYPSLDFNTLDNEGKSLESRVMEYAVENGISKFPTAFRDFYHDKLMQMAEERGKEAVSKDLQKRTKLGLLGQTPTPKKGLSEVQDVKSKSYEDIHREVLEELGIA